MKIVKRGILSKRLLAVAALCCATLASGADDYPNKPIRLIVPYTPGGSIDNTGRLVADQLQKQLGQPIVVENLPGASGLVGTLIARKAKPDGYTLLFNASSQVYMPLVVVAENLRCRSRLRASCTDWLCAPTGGGEQFGPREKSG
jgi:tripartite-type tricarboxylate transporter receptor subunit TctC